jgi:hypothetical protein
VTWIQTCTKAGTEQFCPTILVNGAVLLRPHEQKKTMVCDVQIILVITNMLIVISTHEINKKKYTVLKSLIKCMNNSEGRKAAINFIV